MLIKKLNDVYLHIETNDSLAQELSDYFTIEVPGFKYMPAYRNRMWDGKIRLFSKHTHQIYYGLLPHIEKFCKINSIKYTKEVDEENNIEKDDVDKFIKSLRPKSRGKDIAIRDYQSSCVENAIRKHRGLFLSPTASGKSLIIYSLVRYYQLLLNKQILILVPTTSLVEQMASDFIDYGWEEKYIHKVYSGHDKVTDKPVTISTWQSLMKQNKKFFAKYGCVIGDEAHTFKAKSLTSIMTKLEDCKYKFGFTGTLDGTQTHRFVLEGLFGQVEKITTTKELMDKKTLADLSINCILLKYPQDTCKMIREYTYQEELDFLVNHEERNNFIVNLCKNLKGNTLCLYQLVEKHGSVLYDMMLRTINKKIFFVHGGVSTDDREQIRAITEKSKDGIIIASFGTFSTGINIRNLHNIIFASPTKSRIRSLQSIGRGLRLKDNKSGAKLFDIGDDLTYQNRKNFTLLHFQERINIYEGEEFKYNLDSVKLQ